MSKYIYHLTVKGPLLLIFLALITGCNLPASSGNETSKHQNLLAEKQVTLTFKVHLDEPIPGGDSIYITFLDEVTGLAINPQKYVLAAENPVTYSVSLPFSIGSVLKYRYSREGTSFVDEVTFGGRPVRYRLYHNEGQAVINDVVYRWSDSQDQGKYGRILGQVSDKTTGEPISNLLISIGGVQAFSHSDGSFLIDGLPPGTHNLVFYAIDGSYGIYQQGAVVAADSTTPVSVQLTPNQFVNVLFTVAVPQDTPVDAPIRLAGSLHQLGNTYSNLTGGVSALAQKMPVLGKLPDGRYMVTINLPSGAYIEYKYTLGDGVWSSELSEDGSFFTRRFIVPTTNYEVNDTVETWDKDNDRPLLFEVKVPENTPNDDMISIQFNPGFEWMEPIPMWPSTNAQGQKMWKFELTGPFTQSSTIRYRYCRQGQCGVADDEATMGINPAGREVNLTSNPGVVSDEVINWAWFSSPNEPVNVPEVLNKPRGNDLIAGISFQANHHPSWVPEVHKFIEKVKSLNVNWLFLNPTWTLTNSKLPIIEPYPSQDILSADLVNTIEIAQRQGLQVGIYPFPHFPIQMDLWWQNSSRDYTWWLTFFDRYTSFILHHAIIASKTGASALILGGDWLYPALPGGKLSDGSDSYVLQDSEYRWRELIQKIRQNYPGDIGWILSYPDGVRNPPPFLDSVDQIYVNWSAPIAYQPNTSYEIMKANANYIFTQELLPFQQQVGKPIIIAISYPSVEIGSMGCIPILGGGCLNYDLLYPPNTDITALNLDLEDQATAYNAVLAAINDNDWVSGFVSMGYYPLTAVQDKSISINGKPASGAVWYWSKIFLGR